MGESSNCLYDDYDTSINLCCAVLLYDFDCEQTVKLIEVLLI
jgi:hypothetical protein